MKSFFVLLLPAWLILFTLSTSRAASLEWDRESATNVIGYKVYWGLASRSYDHVIDANDDTIIPLPALTPGTTNFFAVTAYDLDGLESDFSEEVSYAEPFPFVTFIVQNSLDLTNWTDTTNQFRVPMNQPLGFFRLRH